MFSFHYLNDSPIIDIGVHRGLDGNANGPSLIRAPAWLAQPPGKYLLYFAHHEGRAIRLAVANSLTGPWKLQDPNPLELESSLFAVEAPAGVDLDAQALAFIEAGADGDYPHIASPDVWVDDAKRQIRLYYHGRMQNGLQRTRVALSRDGIEFKPRPEILGLPYLRVFAHDGWFYAIAMPGQLYRSRDALTRFEPGPLLVDAPIRHHALLHRAGQWYVFWSRVGDRPECILVSELDTDCDWRQWRFGKTSEVHRAQTSWEGADLPAAASSYGACMEPVNQLRDPAIFEEQGRIYLLYSVAGEQGIAIGELRRT